MYKRFEKHLTFPNKRLTLLALTLCMNTLFNYDCLGHQELKKIAHDRRRVFIEFVSRDGWPDHTPYTVTTTGAPVPAVLKCVLIQ